jgi:L-alanine-DL-glutamate epimerase-like enolase superfamily enzyme
MLENIDASLASGIGGIKIKVGQPDPMIDLRRLELCRERMGDMPLMVDANQQWDRPTAFRVGRVMEQFNLVWIEEPLDAYDVEGHAALAAALDTPIASGEMLVSVAEHKALIDARAVDFIQPDAPRVGGITQFLKIMAMGEQAMLKMAPHFAMELHIHLAAAYAHEPWVEHFDWLNPLFNEHLEIRDGRMHLSSRPGLGITLSDQARAWTVASETFTKA